MKPKTFMLIAGETSGDWLAADLVQALRRLTNSAPALPSTDLQPLNTGLEPRFLGAGGSRMAAAGVQLEFDLTAHAVVGLSDVLKHYLKFRRLFRRLLWLACYHQPEAIICVDFSGFNRRLAHAVRCYARSHEGWFHNWAPKLIQYVSPQVWASRPGRAAQMARDYDLLLSLFPFEKAWYAQRVPQFQVEFVGHPMMDRYSQAGMATPAARVVPSSAPRLLLLPGSRPSELARHLPPMFDALKILRAAQPDLRTRMVLPDESSLQQARQSGLPAEVTAQAGQLAQALAEADVAIASTGTVALECAYWRVPTVALYRTSFLNYQIGKRIVTVKFLAMPNLLANEEVFPEFIQDAATGENLARAALELLRDQATRARILAKLNEIVAMLGGPGASLRAARTILRLLHERPGR